MKNINIETEESKKQRVEEAIKILENIKKTLDDLYEKHKKASQDR